MGDVERFALLAATIRYDGTVLEPAGEDLRELSFRDGGARCDNQLEQIVHLVDLGGERRAAKLDIAGGQGPHVDGRRRLQLAKGLLGGNELSQIHVEVLGGGGPHRQRGGVGDAHVRREALRDRIGQLARRTICSTVWISSKCPRYLRRPSLG